MKNIRSTLFVCGLLSSWTAFAAAAAAPQAQSQPQQRQAPPGACALALRQAGPDNAPTRPQAHKKADFDSLFAPCKMNNMEREDDVSNNEGESPEDRYSKIDEWMELYRRQGAENEHALAWMPTDDYQQFSEEYRRRQNAVGWRLTAIEGRRDGQTGTWNEETGNLPAVPEPQTYAMWLAGVALLAAVGTRRRAKSSAGKAPPAARR